MRRLPPLVLAAALVLASLSCDRGPEPQPLAPQTAPASADSASAQDSTAAKDPSPDRFPGRELQVEGYTGPPDTVGTGWIYKRGEPVKVVYEVHDGLAVLEGDIILGRASEVADTKGELRAMRPRLGVATDGNKESQKHYPDGDIAYEISSDFSSFGKDLIKDAIAMVERSTAGIDLHQRDGESNYIFFRIGSDTTCSSRIGTDGKKDPVNLGGSNSCGVGANAHEILHRLGQFHEQSRCDRDQFIDVHFDRIQEKKKGNFRKACSGATDYAHYEFLSLMHYGPNFFQDSAANAEGLPTITANDPSVDKIGQRDSLAVTDIKAMCALYCQHNDAPTAKITDFDGDRLDQFDREISEGREPDVAATESSDPDDEVEYLHFAWRFDDGTCKFRNSPDVCSSAEPDHRYKDQGTYDVKVTVRDGPFGRDITTGMNMGDVATGFLEDTTSVTITVENRAPSDEEFPDDTTMSEGDTYTAQGVFNDPGAEDDPWTAMVNYDAPSDFEEIGSGAESLPLTVEPAFRGKNLAFDLSHTYVDNGTNIVKVKVTDKDDATGFEDVDVRVANVPPDVDAGPDASIDEGGTFTSSGSFTDPGEDTWSATVNYDDGGGDESLSLSGKSFDLNHTYADNNTYSVQVTVTDDDHQEGEVDGKGSDEAQVTVNNVPPIVDAGRDRAVPSGVTFDFSGTFSDPGVEDDPWSWSIDWDDPSGNTTGRTSDQSAPITASHQVCAAGTNTVTLSVTDKDGGTGSDEMRVEVQRRNVDRAFDVKPGGNGRNPINLRSKRLPVAILSSSGFDATTVDPTTVTLGDGDAPEAEVATRRNGRLFAETEDVNNDGREDLALKFNVQELENNGDLDSSTGELVLRAVLEDGCTHIQGVDAVSVR